MPRVDILVKNAGIGDGAVLPGENQIEKSRRIKGLERCFSFIDSLHKVGYVQEATFEGKNGAPFIATLVQGRASATNSDVVLDVYLRSDGGCHKPRT